MYADETFVLGVDNWEMGKYFRFYLWIFKLPEARKTVNFFNSEY
jgi:hypothetical protein